MRRALRLMRSIARSDLRRFLWRMHCALPFASPAARRRSTDRDLILADLTLAFCAGVCASAVVFMLILTICWGPTC